MIPYEIKLANGGRMLVSGEPIGRYLAIHQQADGKWALTHVPSGIGITRHSDREPLAALAEGIVEHCGARLAHESIDELRRSGALGRIETVMRQRLGFVPERVCA